MARIAINGFGRIGRNIFRAWLEQASTAHEIVAINDLGDPAMNAHLLKYDSVHGTLDQHVSLDGNIIRVADKTVVCSQTRDLHALPWRQLEIDLVLECTGVFTDRASASGHLTAGAERVLISAPATDVDATVVFGVNDSVLDGSQKIVSNASCTTNCLAPLAKVLHEGIGIETGLANTVHAYTNDQRLSDVSHSDVMRARSATQSLIPTKTGAAAAVALVLPELEGRLDGLAVRVPLINVSLLDLTFEASRRTSAEEVNQLIEKAALGMHGVLQINQLPLVSIDFNHNPASSIADLSLTRVRGKLVKVMAWYDNEWGFSNRMLDTADAMLRTSR
ncbi:type I glyceraldehyde-3-phosphate dehydrogenase [Proteobacteria bacterium 005FR1]|nr:type I glyceraldehyde-3-phosphate dehydrogenase [Proteobacteria bacterium 005FR1]